MVSVKLNTRKEVARKMKEWKCWKTWAISSLNSVDGNDSPSKYQRLSLKALQKKLSSILNAYNAAVLSQSESSAHVWEFLSPAKQWLPFDSNISVELELKYLQPSKTKKLQFTFASVTYLVDFSSYTLEQKM